MGVGPLALYALSALSPLVIRDLGVSRAQFGSFSTFAFVVAAMLSAISGRSADALQGRQVLFLLFGGSGLALLAVAGASAYPWLLLAVALSGAAQSLSNPITNQLISIHIPAGRQGLLLGVKQSGVQMSQFAAGLVLPTAALALGWRSAVAATALVAVGGLGLTRRFVPPRSDAAVASWSASGLRQLPVAVWWLTAYVALTGMALQATNVYLPLYSYERLQLSLPAAGLTVALAGGIGVIARIAWGHMTERVAEPAVVLAAMAVAAAAGILLLVSAARIGWPWLVWVGSVLHGASALASNAVVMMALVRRTDPTQVGTASGVLAVGLYLGFAVGPVSFGGLVDSSDSYTVAWAAAAAAYGLAATLVLVWRQRTAAASTPATARSAP